MATKKQASEVEAVVLVDCVFGKVGDVVLLSQADAQTGVALSMVDTAPAAIAHAKGE